MALDPMLELKIPPLLLTALFGVAMYAVSTALPGFSVSVGVRVAVAGAFCAGGAYFALAGVRSFREAHTTVNPTTPDESSSLVTSGVYRRTRNPMYVGFLFFLLALASFLANPWSMLLAAGFVLYMNRFQIVPEERALRAIFGGEYDRYVSKVRRWL